MAITSGIFAAMKNHIKRNMITPLLVRIVRWGFCLVILAAITAGLVVVGSPAQRRREALDTQRINSLSSLTYAIDTYYQTNGQLPATLESLRTQLPYLVADLQDPTTQQAYEYRPLTTLSTTAYELCANFESTLVDPTQTALQTVPLQNTMDPVTWSHGVGRTCYTLYIRTTSQKPTEIRLPSPSASTL